MITILERFLWILNFEQKHFFWVLGLILFFKKMKFFSNFKRLCRNNQEELECPIWLKRSAWVSTFIRTSIQIHTTTLSVSAHDFTKTLQKSWPEAGTRFFFINFIIQVWGFFLKMLFLSQYTMGWLNNVLRQHVWLRI